MKNLIALILICLFASGALAQSKRGMHLKDGAWVKPTPQSAMDAILSKARDTRYAIAVLRQKFDTWSSAELDALADELGRIFLEGTYTQCPRAWS